MSENRYTNFALLFHKPLVQDLIYRAHQGEVLIKSKERGQGGYPLKSKSLFDQKELSRVKFPSALLLNQCSKLRESAEVLLEDSYWRCETFQCTSSFAIGLGTPSFYENGIQLHHLYGFPYIPASSIKGAVRHWTIYRYFDNQEKKALGDPDFCLLFGDGAEERKDRDRGIDYPNIGQSHLIFWDAFPCAVPFLNVDMVNTHFKDYYGKGKSPTDNQNLNPIYFLSIEEGASFQLLIGQRKRGQLCGALSQQIQDAAIDKEAEDQLLQLAFYLLVESLEYWGVGAKTSLGYGRLRLIDSSF